MHPGGCSPPSPVGALGLRSRLVPCPRARVPLQLPCAGSPLFPPGLRGKAASSEHCFPQGDPDGPAGPCLLAARGRAAPAPGHPQQSQCCSPGPRARSPDLSLWTGVPRLGCCRGCRRGPFEGGRDIPTACPHLPAPLGGAPSWLDAGQRPNTFSVRLSWEPRANPLTSVSASPTPWPLEGCPELDPLAKKPPSSPASPGRC